MRILIAGWHGQIAGAFLEIAPGCSDISACAVGRPALDVCEPRSIQRALTDINPDVVINTAAYTEVDEAELQPEKAFALNRDGARLLAQAAARWGAAIIHLSTDYVFDGRKTTPYIETDTANPLTVYGQSKLAGEAGVAAENPRHIILRTSWIFSPFGRNFVKSMLQRAGEGERLRIVDDQQGSPTYAPHLVEAIIAIARRVTANAGADGLWGVYHIANEGGTSWRGLADEAFRQSARFGGPAAQVESISSADYPTRAPRLANGQLDCGRLHEVFGLRLPPWREGVADCVKRLLDH